jgi:hypothetical protein
MRLPSLALILASNCLPFLHANGSVAGEVLITEAEAGLPVSSDAALSARALTRGPAVEQVTPDPDGRVTSPVPLKIKFVGRNSTTIDPGSVRITYLRSPNIDLTMRIQSHITADGIEITQAEAPPGVHVLRIDLRDTRGREGTGTIRLSVAK